MASIELVSRINNDEYTEYVYNQYDIQNRETVITSIPMMDWDKLPLDFNILLILGNSGSGKSTILRLLGDNTNKIELDYDKSIISQFPHKSPEEVAELFCGIGLCSVPTWLKKPNELSNGERARFDIAAQIAFAKEGSLICIDEFTSVVNRPCAQSMSYALQRYIREHKLIVAIASCHYDIVEWLQPDYIYDLNKQENGMCEMQKLIYTDDKEYKSYKMVNEKEILSDARSID